MLIVCTPPPSPPFCWGVELLPIFQKGGGLTGSQFNRGGCWERGLDLFGRGDCSFYIKNKVKCQMFNSKKNLSEKMFFSVTTKNLKVVSATFLLVSIVCLKESTCETQKMDFYYTSKALFVLEIIKF